MQDCYAIIFKMKRGRRMAGLRPPEWTSTDEQSRTQSKINRHRAWTQVDLTVLMCGLEWLVLSIFWKLIGYNIVWGAGNVDMVGQSLQATA